MSCIRQMSRKLCLFLVVLFTVFGLFGGIKPVQAATFKISDKTVNLSISESKDLKISGLKKKIKVTWSSSDKSIAVVSKTGMVTAKKPGKAKIKAVVNVPAVKTGSKASKVVFTSKVTVRQPKLNITKKNLEYGDSFFLKLKYADAVSFTSSNTEVVTADEGGLIKGVNAGAAIVTCTDCFKNTYQCQVTVNPCKHRWTGGAKRTEPTCENEGSVSYTCGICGYESVTKIPALDHIYDVTVIEPTKKAAGCTKYECKRCGKSKVDSIVDYNPTEDQVHKDMMSLSGEFYEGRRYTDDDYYPWEAGIFCAGTGCAGFAFRMSDEAFGYLPARVHHDFDKIRSGDIIRMDNDKHSVIVLRRYDDRVVVAEANYNSSVHWGRQFSISVNAKNWDYVITRYPDHIEDPDKEGFKPGFILKRLNANYVLR